MYWEPIGWMNFIEGDGINPMIQCVFWPGGKYIVIWDYLAIEHVVIWSDWFKPISPAKNGDGNRPESDFHRKTGIFTILYLHVFTQK